jgi:hypothetical protein
MSEVLLQTIIEKLEALEIALLKHDETALARVHQPISNQLKIYQTELQGCSTDVNNISKKVDLLISKLDVAAQIANKAAGGRSTHEHHLHKGLWISAGLFMLVAILIAALINTRNDLSAYEANDIKYRSLNVKKDTALLRTLFRTDSLYNLNRDAFKELTIHEEFKIAERARLLMLAGEKEKEAKKLRDKAKTK